MPLFITFAHAEYRAKNYLNKDSSYLAEVKLKAPPSELPTDTNDQVRVHVSFSPR